MTDMWLQEAKGKMAKYAKRKKGKKNAGYEWLK